MVNSETSQPQSEIKQTKNPRRWWQWLLLYPTFAVALVTAVPQWITVAQNTYDGYNESATKAGKGTAPEYELTRFMKKNDECTRQTLFDPFITPRNAKIWPVICKKTGDIFVVITTSSGDTMYSGVFVDEIADRRKSGKGIFVTSNERTAKNELASLKYIKVLDLTNKAHARSLGIEPRVILQDDHTRELHRTAQVTRVICQIFRQDGTILRRLQKGNICYDELINAANGFVISNTPVDCNSPCPQ